MEPHYPNDFTYKQIEIHDTEEENIRQHFDGSY